MKKNLIYVYAPLVLLLFIAVPVMRHLLHLTFMANYYVFLSIATRATTLKIIDCDTRGEKQSTRHRAEIIGMQQSYCTRKHEQALKNAYSILYCSLKFLKQVLNSVDTEFIY